MHTTTPPSTARTWAEAIEHETHRRSHETPGAPHNGFYRPLLWALAGELSPAIPAEVSPAALMAALEHLCATEQARAEALRTVIPFFRSIFGIDTPPPSHPSTTAKA